VLGKVETFAGSLKGVAHQCSCFRLKNAIIRELIGMVASLPESPWDASIQIQLTDTSAARHKLEMSRLAVKYKFWKLLWTKERLPTNIFAPSPLWKIVRA